MKIIQNNGLLDIKLFSNEIEEGALKQAINLAEHPICYSHIAIMPDCHQGYGMPIGGVIGCLNGIIPNAVGVDIGCGMISVKTNFLKDKITKENIHKILEIVKKRIPRGEGSHHKKSQSWEGFKDENISGAYYSEKTWSLAKKSLGTLGGGNHFIEIQAGMDGFIWLMIHSGSRNLGYSIANFYNKLALLLNEKDKIKIPNKELAFFYTNTKEGENYIQDMNFALSFAKENRKRIIESFKDAVFDVLHCEFSEEINIHHNYANKEKHFGKELWVHRKGACFAGKGNIGIIPGSMGTPSYIVEGLGNKDSFNSSPHGAGRKMSRTKATSELSLDLCQKDMKGIVFDDWKGSKKKIDLSEAPSAYKDIDEVIENSKTLIIPKVKLYPIGVVKG